MAVMTVDCTTTTEAGLLVARLAGRLDRRAVAGVRAALHKCLADQPDALLVDVSGLTVVEPIALAVFTAVVRQAGMWPGTPVLICAPSPALARLLGVAAYRRLPVFATLQAGRDEAQHTRVSLPTISDDLLPIAGAARQARDTATEACLRWDLPLLVGAASSVAGELVSNVVVHAGTMMTLRLSLWRRSLLIAVRDGSSVTPVLTDPASTSHGGGRGLRLVDALARSWGSLPSTTGKVVWASLDADPPA
jgi:anti-anti-sigma regulatory factor